LLQRLGLLPTVAGVFGARWRMLAATLPRLRLANPPDPVAAVAPGQVLFVGCLAPQLDAETLASAHAVLVAIGQPARSISGCCGALARHAGRPQEADALRTRATHRGTPLLCSATGCAAELGADGRELTAWLAGARFPTDVAWEVAPLRVAVHVPCTQRHALRDRDASERLLARLPGVRVVARVDAGCCGAAGSQLLGNPAQADALGDAQARALVAADADLVVTPNWGCARHLAARAAADGAPLAPVHPVTLLARRLKPRC